MKAFDGKSGEKDYFALKSFQGILPEPLELKKALSFGPLIASIQGGCENFKNYKSGIIDKCDSQPNLMTAHAVLIIGYGTEVFNDVPLEYFIIKNSFGTNWGE